MATQPKPQPVDNLINVRIGTDANGNPQTIADMPALMHVGETVEFFTNDGELRVEFNNGTPFETDKLDGGEVRELIKTGRFRAACVIKTQNGEVGYGTDGGGVVDVGPKHS